MEKVLKPYRVADQGLLRLASAASSPSLDLAFNRPGKFLPRKVFYHIGPLSSFLLAELSTNPEDMALGDRNLHGHEMALRKSSTSSSRAWILVWPKCVDDFRRG